MNRQSGLTLRRLHVIRKGLKIDRHYSENLPLPLFAFASANPPVCGKEGTTTPYPPLIRGNSSLA
jgi:hypothetical protein